MKLIRTTGLLALVGLLLTACAGTPSQKINGLRYKPETSDLTANRSLISYLNAKQPSHNLYVEKQQLPANQLDTFILGWLLKEQQARQQLCTIQAKQHDEIEYFVCQSDEKMHIIYQLATDPEERQGIAKIFVVRDGVLSTEDEQAVVESLDEIK